MLGVAEAKRRFRELLDRIEEGERVTIARRGRPAAVLVPPDRSLIEASPGKPKGLAAFAGALADWPELDAVVDEIYASRRSSADRPAPELD